MPNAIATLPFTLPALAEAYAGGVRPEAVVAEAFRRLDAAGDPGIFLHESREAAVSAARALGAPDGRPLWGVPFAVKDNIDVAGMPTTAACPDFSHVAQADAFAVMRLREAGAIPLGKTNLDQFATGLVGVRTPYPVPRNAIDAGLVPGGSSSGSAVAVSLGLVAFSLGTDTAGSGRVPAALNNIVGLKPTLGALSATGMLPACRTLDTISIFAQTVADAWVVFAAAAAFDRDDAYARPWPLRPLETVARARIGVPDAASLRTFGNAAQANHFRETVEWLRAGGATVEEIDFSPFYAVADLLYGGAWVAERVAAVGARLAEKPETLHPTTRKILEPGLKLSAAAAFEGIYRLQALKRRCAEAMERLDALCVPTIPTEVTLAEIAADPIGPNSGLGTYTNFVNLLDLCGIAVPTGLRTDGRPGSATVLARADEDALAAGLALNVEKGNLGATEWARPAAKPGTLAIAADEIALAVCGAHMSGLPLNRELTGRGGRFLRATHTAKGYQLFAMPGEPPFRPGLVRTGHGGAGIAVEVWALPRTAAGDFLSGVPSPLCIGTVALEDGSAVKGFLCESRAMEGAVDISRFGGWRGYLQAQSAQQGAAA